MDTDKIKGMLIGLALGDALGAPHEFKYQHNEFVGRLVYPVKLFNRFHGETVFNVGSVTDDTQMTLILANQIIKDKNYNRNNVILAYEEWAFTGKMLGKNTRALFKGVKTIKGYENRYNKIFSAPIEEWTQSNGSLMRCSPLIIFNNFDNFIIDTKLSNPHPNNIDCGIIYLFILKSLAIKGVLPEIDTLERCTKSVEIRDVINDVKNKVIRDIAPKAVRGWVITAFYCALYSIYNIPDMNEAFKFFINKKGDTDTNAAILGALYGAKLGFNKLNLDNINKNNIDILLNNNDILKDIDNISNKLCDIYIIEKNK